VREYLVSYEGRWWHFYIKPFYGLCYRKKEGARFGAFEVLFSDACEDFCALTCGGQLHIVCQDKSGNILHICYDKTVWRKMVLLESKAATPYPKHFSLISLGGYLNLFYIITYKDRHMLVHQILDAKDRPPTVIDHVHPATPPYIAAAHTGTEITVLYENESGVCGSRSFRWSRKEFGRFMPVHPASGSLVRGLHVQADDSILYAGFKTLEDVTNLVFFQKTQTGDFTEPVTVYLDCPTEAMPIFCKNQEKLYMVWRENGGIMSAYSTDGGEKWSKPLRYMKGAALAPVLFTVQQGEKRICAYGHSTDREVILYAVPELEDIKTSIKKAQPAGAEAEHFARRMGAQEESQVAEQELPDSVLTHIKEELTALKGQFLTLRMELKQIQDAFEVIYGEGAELASRRTPENSEQKSTQTG